MPIYEYRCQKCHKVFEEWHKHADEDTSHPCPECQGTAERIISNTSFMLKGGGWYATEYGNRKTPCSADCAKADGGAGCAKADSSASSSPAPSCSTACAGSSCTAD